MSKSMEYIWPGIIAAQAIHAATKLGIADLLSSGPKSVAELGVDSGAHPPSLDYLLRALSTLGVFAITPDGRFCNTSLSDVLRADLPGFATGLRSVPPSRFCGVRLENFMKPSAPASRPFRGFSVSAFSNISRRTKTTLRPSIPL